MALKHFIIQDILLLAPFLLVQCHGLSQSQMIQMEDLKSYLDNKEVFPVLDAVINGVNTILLDPEAERSVHQVLDNALNMINNENILLILEKLTDYTRQGFETKNARELLIYTFAFEDYIFNDPKVMQFLENIASITINIINQENNVEFFDNLFSSLKRLSQDSQIKNLIADSFLALIKLSNDPKMIENITLAIKAFRHILENDEARSSIKNSLRTYTGLSKFLSQDNIRNLASLGQQVAKASANKNRRNSN